MSEQVDQIIRQWALYVARSVEMGKDIIVIPAHSNRVRPTDSKEATACPKTHSGLYVTVRRDFVNILSQGSSHVRTDDGFDYAVTSRKRAQYTLMAYRTGAAEILELIAASPFMPHIYEMFFRVGDMGRPVISGITAQEALVDGIYEPRAEMTISVDFVDVKTTALCDFEPCLEDVERGCL